MSRNESSAERAHGFVEPLQRTGFTTQRSPAGRSFHRVCFLVFATIGPKGCGDEPAGARGIPKKRARCRAVVRGGNGRLRPERARCAEKPRAAKEWVRFFMAGSLPDSVAAQGLAGAAIPDGEGLGFLDQAT